MGPPSMHLGGHLRLRELANGVKAWGFSSTQCVKAAVANVEKQLRDEGWKSPNKATTPLTSNYRPELDVTAESDPQGMSHCQSLIGVLRWIVELGRVDICLEVSMMSSHLAFPREGHLDQVCHIFACLRDHSNSEMVLDPSEPIVD